MRRDQWWALVLAAVAGLGLILLGYVFDTSFQQSLFVNLGTAVLLFSALYIFERHVLERRVSTVRAEVTAKVAAVDEKVEAAVTEVRRELALALDDLGEQMKFKLEEQHATDVSSVDAFRNGPTAITTSAMLRRALRLAAISEKGVRVQIPGMYNRLRFGIVDVNTDAVRVSLERWGGEVLVEFGWTTELRAEELFLEIAESMQRTGIYPGDTSFDVGRILHQLADSVELGLLARTGRGGAASELGPIIEVLGPQWCVTEDGIEAIGRHRYVIQRWRVHDGEWFAHMRNKSWVDEDEFDHALETARQLFPANSTADSASIDE